ncbi:hypothetical protein CVV26_02935 [Candidatus Kuenenbacteria bacterium HGW-Kuenenbacteria-1]|uniref:Uncharacterized protein n=1 Tax=Candidatus Kuenenbacteria bacterium HGW-Kuenenbacteria-1 TaxID=2013812 RepID=A0A2N1UN17_9BACT|nr:MAG: hypothetical protein CVV26_02935 [Candidatus Kuenenbacteria bacterium HGW-Kuenenbacteria-1]
MIEQIKKQFNEPEILDSEKERELKEIEKETISYEKFKEISKRVLEQYKDPKNNEIRFAMRECKILEVNEKIINSFPDEETQNLCRKILSNFPDKTIEINKKELKILQKKIDDWKEVIYEEFVEKINKDFSSEEMDCIGHLLWIRILNVLSATVDKKFVG